MQNNLRENSPSPKFRQKNVKKNLRLTRTGKSMNGGIYLCFCAFCPVLRYVKRGNLNMLTDNIVEFLQCVHNYCQQFVSCLGCKAS